MVLPVLTPSERLEAVQRISLIKGKLKGRKGKGKGKNDARFYARLETALSANLKANWRDEYTKALKEVFAILPDKLTKEAVDLLEQTLLDALGPAFGISPYHPLSASKCGKRSGRLIPQPKRKPTRRKSAVGRKRA